MSLIAGRFCACCIDLSGSATTPRLTINAAIALAAPPARRRGMSRTMIGERSEYQRRDSAAAQDLQADAVIPQLESGPDAGHGKHHAIGQCQQQQQPSRTSSMNAARKCPIMRNLRHDARGAQTLFVTDLFATANPAAPLAERLRPKIDRRRDRAAPPARAGQAAGGRLRVGQAAFDDPVGAAGRRQDHARAPDGRRVQRRVHRAVRGALRRQGHPRRGRARRGDARAVGRGTRSCSSTRCTASTRRSRTRSCRSSSRASSPSSARRPRTRRSR